MPTNRVMTGCKRQNSALFSKNRIYVMRITRFQVWHLHLLVIGQTKTQGWSAKMNTLKNIFFASLTAATLFSAANTANAGVSGLYYDHTGRSAVQVSKCGSGLCGKIVWLKNKAHESVCGTRIIGGGQKVGNSYDTGWIYDPERGRKFNVEITPMGNSLKVMGYAGSKFLSKTMVWRRAPSNLERCS